MNEEVSQFVATLFHAGTITHFQHLQTKEYSVHKALGKFYPKIVDLADGLAESYQGRYATRMLKFPDELHEPKESPTEYLTKLKEFVQEARGEIPQNTELQNIVDEIADLINSTLYLLTLK
jgi:DNA-binding ferritin-like protein